MTWSIETKEKWEAIREYQRDEAKEAVVKILEDWGGVLKRKEVCARAAKFIKKLRRASGVLELPTIENITVPQANAKFINSNWKMICWLSAKEGKYIIPSRDGVRLGTIEEYRVYAEENMLNITVGMADSINERADIIIEKGGECKRFGVTELLLPSGD